MVQILVSEFEENELLERGDNIFKSFPETILYKTSNSFIKKEGSDKYTIKYQVAPSYRAAATNNKITCYIIQPTGIIKKEQELIFSQFDYTGSDYMFTLNLGKLIRPISKTDKKKVYTESELYADNFD